MRKKLVFAGLTSILLSSCVSDNDKIIKSNESPNLNNNDKHLDNYELINQIDFYVIEGSSGWSYFSRKNKSN